MSFTSTHSTSLRSKIVGKKKERWEGRKGRKKEKKRNFQKVLKGKTYLMHSSNYLHDILLGMAGNLKMI